MEVAQNGWFHFMDNPIYKLILTRGTRISGHLHIDLASDLSHVTMFSSFHGHPS